MAINCGDQWRKRKREMLDEEATLYNQQEQNKKERAVKEKYEKKLSHFRLAFLLLFLFVLAFLLRGGCS